MLALFATHIALLVLLLASCWAAGWLLLGRRQPALIAHPLLPAVGFALLGQGAWLLALCGSLWPWVVIAVVAASLVAAAPGWSRLVRHLRGDGRRHAAPLAIAMAVAMAPAFLLALYPPNAYDETGYHLPFAQTIATTGALPWRPELRTPTFPLLAEALQAPLLRAGGASATHLPAVLCLGLTAALLLAWARELRGAAAGWMAAAIWIGSPVVVYIGATDYIELPMALLATATFYASWRSARASTTAPGDDSEMLSAIGWAALAGFLGATAADAKYLGLYVLLVVGLHALLTGSKRLARAVTATTVAVVTLALAYGRLWTLTGNPLFPFLGSVFGRGLWSVPLPPEPLSRVIVAVLRMPYAAVLDRPAAGWQPPLSPAFLLFLPLVLILAWRTRAARSALLVVGGFFVVMLMTPHDVRYLLVVLPLWSMLTAIALLAACPALERRARAVGAAAALLALPGFLYAPYQVHRLGPLPANAGEVEAFAATQLPGYRALARLERATQGRCVVYMVDGDRLQGYARARRLGAWGGPWSYWWVLPHLADPPRLSRALRGSGVTHLILPSTQAPAVLRQGGGGLFRVVDEVDGYVTIAVLPPPSAHWSR